MTREILSTRTHYTSVIVKLLLCAALLWSFTLMTASPVAATSPAQPQPFTPFLDIVPNAHGTAINITVRGAGDASVTLDGHIFDPTDPTGFKEGWTGTYSGTLSAHFAGNVGSFSPQTTVTRTLEFTTSTGLRMEPTGLNRGFLPLETEDPPTAYSADNRLQLQIIDDNTFDSDTYVVVVTDPALPGPLPAGYHQIGESYSVRASGAIIDTNQDMSLSFRLPRPLLAATDPNTLGIYRWNVVENEWQQEPQTLSPEGGAYRIATTTEYFGTYAVLSHPVWDAKLDTDLSLDQSRSSNVVIGDFPVSLLLDPTPGNGTGVSVPITPTSEFERWETVEFSGTAQAPGSALTMDVLDVDGALIMSNITSGVSLADLDPATYPALRLRVNLTSTVDAPAPRLHSWRVSWTPTPTIATPRSPSVADDPAAGDATIYGTAASAELGDTVPISLVIDAPNIGISTGTIDLRYDPTVAQLVGCTTSLLDGAVITCNATFDKDSVAPDSARISFIANPPIESPSAVAQLAFTILNGAATDAQIDIEVLRLTDNAGNPITAETNSGVIHIGSAPGDSEAIASGDVNCDGTTDITDAALIVAYDANLVEAADNCPVAADELHMAACDMNQDAVCSLEDALLIMR